MKYLIISFLIVSVSFLNSYARKVEGRIIFNKNDSMDVTFNIPVKLFSGEPNYEKLQYRVKYYSKEGKPFILRPDDAQEIQFEYPDKIRMLSRRNNLGGHLLNISTNIFLKLEKDGELKLFSYFYTRSSPGTYNASTGGWSGGYYYSTDRYVFQLGSGELKKPRPLFFRKDMLEYFKGCPALTKMIENKEFRSGDIEMIVDYYNLHCK